MTCKHTKIQTWADAETSEPVALWSCVDCGRKFEPVDVERDADAERYRWLRDKTEWQPFDERWLCAMNIYGQGPEDLDATIDAARKHTP